ncbi:MAG: Cof-type HAD-IIB family hydrolase [Peptostreptococcaceae bacterium]
MIKHIFCDLDGTLYQNGISNEDIRAIEEIESKGVKFHIATGRALKQASKMIEDKVDIKGYYICQNGAFIYDKNLNIVLKETIDDNLARKVVDRFESNSSHIYFMHNGNIIISGGEDVLDEYDKDCIKDPKFFKKDSYGNLVGNIGIISEDTDELGRMELYYKGEFKELLDVYLSAPHILSIAPKHISKRNAIKHVCDILDVDLNEIATIGDSPNDICMLEGFKYSFVMEGARDNVKECANYSAKNVREVIKIIEKINGVE